MNNQEKEVVLMLPVIEEEPEKKEREFFPSSGSTAFRGTSLPVSMEQVQELVKGFTDFSLDSIELHVKGVAQTDGLVKLFVGLSGEAGVKLVLKKNEATAE
ncbi:hypothetical protein [Domibacillus mangrovi]|uniref:Uncharacterized protein n=1 Tax=Domibacillus mangrovi TaxID=1714354 RepID=A0A1Q5P5V7_9BACI|nr:hypothetical protein [Domibacillus mangrovi]OKL37614.1 hypothetical protein BLL40_04735 [Domibacillus mangrovi]